MQFSENDLASCSNETLSYTFSGVPCIHEVSGTIQNRSFNTADLKPELTKPTNRAAMPEDKTFTWDSISCNNDNANLKYDSTEYTMQISKSNGFDLADILSDKTIANTNSYTLTDDEYTTIKDSGLECFYWRVKAETPCPSNWSDVAIILFPQQKTCDEHFQDLLANGLTWTRFNGFSDDSDPQKPLYIWEEPTVLYSNRNNTLNIFHAQDHIYSPLSPSGSGSTAQFCGIEIFDTDIPTSLTYNRMILTNIQYTGTSTPSPFATRHQENSIIFDPSDNRNYIINVGGATQLQGGANPNFEEQTIAGTAPIVRKEHVFISDPIDNEAYLYGGIDQSTLERLGDTWSLNLNVTPPTWTELTPDVSPVHRGQLQGTYVDQFRSFYIFGGIIGTCPDNPIATEDPNPFNDSFFPEPEDACWRFDMASNQWHVVTLDDTTLPNMRIFENCIEYIEPCFIVIFGGTSQVSANGIGTEQDSFRIFMFQDVNTLTDITDQITFTAGSLATTDVFKPVQEYSYGKYETGDSAYDRVHGVLYYCNYDSIWVLSGFPKITC